MAASATQRTDNLRPWQPGQSGNPGGSLKGLKELQKGLMLSHGGKVFTALQRILEMGMDERTYTATDKRGEPIEVPIVDAKTRVAALSAFVEHVGRLTGLASLAARTGETKDETPQDEGELLERVVETVCKRNPELVAGKLLALQGGKTP